MPTKTNKQRSFTVKVGSTAYARTHDGSLAAHIAGNYLAYKKSVTIFDNLERRTVARYIYGHRQ